MLSVLFILMLGPSAIVPEPDMMEGTVRGDLVNTQAQQVTDDLWAVQSLDGPSQPNTIQTIPVDLNQDGLMDVVSASFTDGSIRSYINQGQFNFIESTVLNGVDGMLHLSAQDINADGQQDFLVTSLVTETVFILQSTPTGHQQVTVATGNVIPIDASFGDFNGDLKADVVSLDFISGQLLLHLRSMSDGYQTTVIADDLVAPRALLVDDFDQDKDADVMVVSSADNSLRLYVNDGNGTFQSELIADDLMDVRAISPCDFDDNQLMDVVVAVHGSQELLLFENLGNRQFFEVLIDAEYPAGIDMVCAQLDQDPSMELVTVSGQTSEIHLHQLNQNTGRVLLANKRDGYASVRVADFDGSGKQWVLTQAYFEARNLLYDPDGFNQELVVWEDFPEGLISAFYARLPEVKAFYNGFRDGTIRNLIQGLGQLLFTDSFGLRALFQDRTVSFGFTNYYSVNSETGAVFKHSYSTNNGLVTETLLEDLNFPVTLEQLNAASQDWLVVGSTFEDRLVLINEAGATREVLVGTGTFDLEVADFNNDGLQDIAIADYLNGMIKLAQQTSTGDFLISTLAMNKPRALALKSTDLDGDLDLDLVFLVNQTNQLWWLENTPAGFTEHLITNQIQDPRWVDVINSGPQVWLAVASLDRDSGGVYLLKTADAQNFSLQKIHHTIFGTTVVDFDRNNDTPQLLAGNSGNSHLYELSQGDLIFISGF